MFNLKANKENKEVEGKVLGATIKSDMETAAEEKAEKPQITKEEFINMLFTNKKFKFIPNKQKAMMEIRKMSEQEFQDLIVNAYGHILNSK